jgi:hypothetical protein
MASSPRLAFATLDAARAFVSRFEDGSLPRAEWVHASHLAVAFWYLSTLEETEATDRLRAGIRHYNSCQGIANTRHSGYHETLTRFWIAAVRSFLRAAGAGPHRVEVLQSLLDAAGARKDLWRDFYSIDLLSSVEARLDWVEPDRRPLTDEAFGWDLDPSARGL